MSTSRLSDEEMLAITTAVAVEMAAGTTDAYTRYGKRAAQTVRHNNLGPDTQGGSMFGIGARATGRLARFAGIPTKGPAKRSEIELRHDHPALSEGRSIFPSRVMEIGKTKRALVAGSSNSKIGAYVTAGVWAGLPIYTLSLEERATCPRSCAVWASCYGNAMSAAIRLRYDDALIHRLEEELQYLNRKHPRGFAVRLHVLGDFVDLAYLKHWARWSDRFKALRVWGYTAHDRESTVGRMICMLNASRPARWQVRFSVGNDAPQKRMQAAVIWEMPERTSLHDGALVCPQELGKTETCGTCGICWKPELAHVRILFVAHGRGRAPPKP